MSLNSNRRSLARANDEDTRSGYSRFSLISFFSTPINILLIIIILDNGIDFCSREMFLEKKRNVRCFHIYIYIKNHVRCP